jgi:hypothetical protein
MAKEFYPLTFYAEEADSGNTPGDAVVGLFGRYSEARVKPESGAEAGCGGGGGKDDKAGGGSAGAAATKKINRRTASTARSSQRRNLSMAPPIRAELRVGGY